MASVLRVLSNVRSQLRTAGTNPRVLVNQIRSMSSKNGLVFRQVRCSLLNYIRTVRRVDKVKFDNGANLLNLTKFSGSCMDCKVFIGRLFLGLHTENVMSV